MAKNEPQSYGSQGEWVKGDVGEKVNRPKDTPKPPHGDFYESRHTPVEEEPHSISPIQAADNATPGVRPSGPVRPTEDDTSLHNVSGEKSGAKRGGFFKKRDYE
jgi:hypothetical protein